MDSGHTDETDTGENSSKLKFDTDSLSNQQEAKGDNTVSIIKLKTKANDEKLSNNCEEKDFSTMQCDASDKDNVKHKDSSKHIKLATTIETTTEIATELEILPKELDSSLSHGVSEEISIKNSSSLSSVQEKCTTKMDCDPEIVNKASQVVSNVDNVVQEEDMDVDSEDLKTCPLLVDNKEIKCDAVDNLSNKLKSDKVKASETNISSVDESKDDFSKLLGKVDNGESMEIDEVPNLEISQANSKTEMQSPEVSEEKVSNEGLTDLIVSEQDKEENSNAGTSKENVEENDSSVKLGRGKLLDVKATTHEVNDGKDCSKATENFSKDGSSENMNNQKDKGKGIDAIAEKLGLQAKGTSNIENNTPETSNGVKETSNKQKVQSEKVGSSAGKTNGTSDKMEDKEKGSETPVSSDQKSGTPKSETSKSKKPCRSCAECGVTKGLKFQVLYQGKTRYLCSDTCFKSFRAKQKLTPTGTAGSSTAAGAKPKCSLKDICTQCKKELKDDQGFFPAAGESKPLCSEECLKKYHQANGCKKMCSQCKNSIESGKTSLTWETMEFCNEDCLGKYQAFLGSHCTCCQTPVQQASLGKYCVRFGTDIRQFCTGRCLEEFKKGLKVCSFCQKDLSSNVEGFLAPVGDKGQFKDFCTQQCMERYETMNSSTSSSPEMQECSHCKKTSIAKLQVQHKEKTHFMCSDLCISGFRYSNKIPSGICYTCFKLFDIDPKEQFVLQYEAGNKHFCTKACMTLFVLSHRKIVPCTSCKVKKYNFDMIEKVDSNNQVNLFCSLNCLSVHRAGAVITPTKSIRCDHCSKNVSVMYHLTMSDGSIRNFCSYNCVITFQNQFTNVPTLTTTTTSARPSSNAQVSGTKTTNASSTPIISSVMSLAPSTPSQRPPSAPAFSAKPVPQKAPPVRQLPPPLSVVVTKSQTSVSTTTAATSSTSTSGASSVPQVIREVIVKPAAPKSMKNKTILCKPIMQSKGVTCKPQPCHKAVQTDDGGGRPIIVPIPVPIYVPTPVIIYSRPVPCPVPFPVPIPVPIFVPTTKDSPTQIIKQLKDIQEKIPANPFEAELLMMAEMAAENDGRKEEVKQNNAEVPDNYNLHTEEPVPLPPPPPPPLPANNVEPPEIPLDLEAALPPSVTPMLKKEQENASDQDEYIPKETRTRTRSAKRSVAVRGRGRGRKRTKLEEFSTEDSDSLAAVPVMEDQMPPLQPVAPDAHLCLKYTFGVNAWKHWVLQKNAQLEKGSQSSRKFKLFKTDLLQLPPDELNYSLCLFVKEVRKPNGEEYAADSIYYLCLGIQQYLFENGRIDNIFTDAYYEKFTECLNDVLQKQEEQMTIEGFFVSRIEEEILWESKQLGAHSPHVLLNTLMYFNTKYFVLKTVDDHTHLSFSHITKHWRKTPMKSAARNVLLRYYPPMNKDWQRRRKDETVVYEQSENILNPLRCPVKLYEFYLSKCPESVKARNDVFYLYPERSCVPDSPVWYSTQPLGQDTIAKMLQRIKTVREINEN